VPETIFWWAVGSIALWFLIYIFIALGFMFCSESKRKSSSLSTAAYASAFWVFCIGDYFVGPLLFTVFFLALAIVVLALCLRSARA
jgi:hypothetical protein